MIGFIVYLSSKPCKQSFKFAITKKFVRKYKDAKVEQKENDVRVQVIQQFGCHEKIMGACLVNVVYLEPISISRHKKKNIYPMPHIQTPDEDNIKKLLYDAMKGYVFHDDRQIFSGCFKKWFVEPTQKRRLLIQVMPIKEWTLPQAISAKQQYERFEAATNLIQDEGRDNGGDLD